jgi:4-hydroxybutyrate CoA-transferase
MHDNPGIIMRDIAFVNSIANISHQPKMTAINSAIEVDLTGQVCADSIGTKAFSGFGGQIDFIAGAGQCPDGVPVIALPSTTNKNESRIVDMLKPGAGVVTTRAHVRYVVTEYGIARLWGKGLRDRAKELIGVAHPDHRAKLYDGARARGLL